MKRFLFMAVIFLSVVLSGVPVHAQNTPMTEAHTERIRSNCIEAQTSLRQLHASDALLRYNRGRAYETISTKLMAPFNSRVSLARADSLGLPAITSQYERQLTDFRAAYKTYEESLSELLKMNCTNQPVGFYDAVAATRAKRKVVFEITQAIKKSVEAYRAEFDVFKAKFGGNS